MKAIVCVKQVPDTSGKVSVNDNGTLDRASMETITNPDDLNALEAALQLRTKPAVKSSSSPWVLPPQKACCVSASLAALTVAS